MNAAPMRHHRRENAIQTRPNESFDELKRRIELAASAKSGSRPCFTFVNGTTPTAPKTVLPTKFAAAKKTHRESSPLREAVEASVPVAMKAAAVLPQKPEAVSAVCDGTALGSLRLLMTYCRCSIWKTFVPCTLRSTMLRS